MVQQYLTMILEESFGPAPTFSFIEPAMAYQRGLPELFITEALVSDQGWRISRGGIFPFRVLIWDSSKGVDYFFESVEWKEMLQNWSAEVRSGYYLQTKPRL